MTSPSSLFDEYERQAKWRSVAAVLGQIGPFEGKKVADLGCGSGYVARMFEASGARVTGIDRDPDLIALAAQKAPRVRWMNADVSNPGAWGCSGFDIIWSSFTIAYAPDPAVWLERWRAALVPGGRIVLIDVGGLLDHEPIGARSFASVASRLMPVSITSMRRIVWSSGSRPPASVFLAVSILRTEN